MDDTNSFAHTKWECKYHAVWIPKYRKKKLFEELRKELGPVLRELAKHKECEILESGQHFWARGYYVSAVGLNEVILRQYIQKQTDEDRRSDQLSR
jgi:putative transposase